MRIQQSARGDRMTHQSFFIGANVETQWFLQFDTPSRGNYHCKVLWDSKKLDFSESRGWLWESRKNFLCVVRPYCLLSETSLGPCASSKVRGVIAWRTNHFLLTQTWKHSDFCILIPLQESFTSEKHQNSVKIACKWVKVLALRGTKKFSVRRKIILFAFGDFFETMRIQQSAQGDRMTHQSIFIGANVETQ